MNQLHYKQEQIKSASFGIGRLLLIPQYLLLATATSLIFALVIFFAINANFYGPLMMSQLPFLDKIALLGDMLSDIFTQGFTSINGALLIVVSVLQGISIAAVIFTAKKNKVEEKTVTRQVGLSIILPIIAIFFSGAAAATAANIASTIVLTLALLLSVFSLYKSGKIVFMYTELAKQEKES